MSFTYRDLRELSDEELIDRHDRSAENTGMGVRYFLEELARRDVARRERRMERLTLAILILTIANVALVATEVL